jgi:predicted ATPase/DNA-binding SARP family transcriptional activator/Tfp pilus assembly protein PilF
MWTIQLFGLISAQSSQRKITRFRTQKAASLLAFLAFRLSAYTRETLIDFLWPDAEIETGRHNLSNALLFLRHQLEPPGTPRGSVIIADRFNVSLNPEVVTTDVSAFEAVVRKAGQQSCSRLQRMTFLMQTSSLYKGRLLPGLYDDWIDQEATRLENVFVQSMILLGSDLLAEGQLDSAISYFERAATVDPLSEEATFAFMRALTSAGRQGLALRAYQGFSRRLRTSLDLEPSPELQSFAAQLKLHGTSIHVDKSLSSSDSMTELSTADTTSTYTSQLDGTYTPHTGLLGGEFLRRTTTRFFGREDATARLIKILCAPRTRLVTVTGAGGIGKTRFSIEAAAQLVNDVEQKDSGLTSAVFVSFADTYDVDRMFEVIISAMGTVTSTDAKPIDQLTQLLNSQPCSLLILDNFEHLAESGALYVKELLARTSNVKILATSRHKLQLEGESEFRLSSLPTSGGADTLEQLINIPSIALFVDRAQSVLSDFQLTQRNAAQIAQLVDYLEGLPLSIELAASRVSVLSPASILKQIQGNRLDFLSCRRRDSTSRQRTLRSTLDWSYNSLPGSGQRLLSILSVFRGGWSTEAALALSEQSQWETIELLMLLRDCSFIDTLETENGLRFTMLEVVREYAAEHLAASGEPGWSFDNQEKLGGFDEERGIALHRVDSLNDKSLTALESRNGTNGGRYRILEPARQYESVPRNTSVRAGRTLERHGNWALELAELAYPHFSKSDQDIWHSALNIEHDNLKAALDWSSSNYNGDTVALRLVAALWPFWLTRGYSADGLHYTRRILNRKVVDPITPERAKAYMGAGVLVCNQGDYLTGRTYFEESLEIFRKLDDKNGIASVLNALGNAAHALGEHDKAWDAYEASITIIKKQGDDNKLAGALHNLGNMAHSQGDLDHARSLYEEGLKIVRKLNNKHTIATTLRNLGNLVYAQGEIQLARTMYEESLSLFREQEDKQHIALLLDDFGDLAYASGDYVRATDLYQESLNLRTELQDRRGIAISLHNLGNAASALGAIARADELYRNSLTLS